MKRIIEQILLSQPHLTRQEVSKMIEEKKKSSGGYFTDETAARIVATELGVETLQKPFPLEIQIQDLVSGLNDVTVAGRVIAVYPPKTYMRRDWTEGKFARFLIADRSGTLKVVLWNDETNRVETAKVEEGKIVKVSHGYVRRGLDGKLELHVGSRGGVQISPPETPETKYPPITQWDRKVAEIAKEGGPVNVEGTIATVPVVREVVTSRNEEISVASFELGDDTGKIRVSAWRGLAEVVKGLAMGTRIKIRNAFARRGFADQLELTSRSITSLEVLNEPEK